MLRIANAASGKPDRWFESNRSRSSSSVANILSKNSLDGFEGEKISYRQVAQRRGHLTVNQGQRNTKGSNPFLPTI